MMERIVRVHFENLDQELLRQALKAFYALRGLRGLQKKPSTSELIDWIQALQIGGIDPQRIAEEMPFVGVLLKKYEDFGGLARGGNTTRIW
jgi:MoxR-like ATPase